MRYMTLYKPGTENDMPTEKEMAAVGQLIEEMAKAGTLITTDGLQPSSKGARVRFSGPSRTVIDGPFAETKELVAGFWLIQVKSKEEAIEWVKRAPNPFLTGESEIEIRQVFEADDFGPELTPEVKEYEERLGKQMAANARK